MISDLVLVVWADVRPTYYGPQTLRLHTNIRAIEMFKLCFLLLAAFANCRKLT